MPESINYEKIVAQLKKELLTDCAIANRYGIILSSNIEIFPTEKVIPQKILELIGKIEPIAEELNLKQINSFAFEAKDFNFLFTFSKELILISKVDLNINLAKFMPSIRAFTLKLSDIKQEQEIKSFSMFDFSNDIAKIEATLKKETINKEKFSVIKDLIKYISS
jgi:hypothetical protein